MIMGQCVSRIWHSTSGTEHTIELDRGQVRADERVVHTYEHEDYLSGQDRAQVQRVLSCATELRALWVDLQWPSISLQRQALTLASLINSFKVNKYEHLQILSVRLEGVSDCLVQQLCDLCIWIERKNTVQLELWLHTSCIDEQQMTKLLKHLGKVQHFQTVALTGMSISRRVVDRLASALRHKAVRRLMLGDVTNECGQQLAGLINYLQPNYLEYLHLWTGAGSYLDGFLENLDNKGLYGLVWMHLVAYDTVPFDKIPNELVMDLVSMNSRLSTIDMGYSLGPLPTGCFVQLIEDWLKLIIDHPSDRQLQVAYLNIQLSVHIEQVVQKHWPNAQLHCTKDQQQGDTKAPGHDGEWTLDIPWTDTRLLRVHNANTLQTFASQSKKAHLQLLMADSHK